MPAVAAASGVGSVGQDGDDETGGNCRQVKVGCCEHRTHPFPGSALFLNGAIREIPAITCLRGTQVSRPQDQPTGAPIFCYQGAAICKEGPPHDLCVHARSSAHPAHQGLRRAVSHPSHLLRGPQLCRAHQGNGRRYQGPAVLLPEESRQHRHRWQVSLSAGHAEPPLRDRAGGGAEIGRREHQAGRRHGPRVRLCRGHRHDAARPAGRGQEAGAPVGGGQGVRGVRTLHRIGAGGTRCRPVEGRHLGRRQRRAAADRRSQRR